MTEDEIVRWHHGLNRNKFEQTPGDGEGQGSPGVYALKVTYYISCLGLPSQNTTDDGLNKRNSFFSQIRGQKKPETEVLARLVAPEDSRENLFLG